MNQRIAINRENVSASTMVGLVADELAESKAEDVVILEIHPHSSLCEYFVVASGGSGRHVRAMADRIAERMHGVGIKGFAAEGTDEGRWVLLDLGDVIVHLFHQPVREFFDLEGLWSQARRLDPVEFVTALRAEPAT